MNMERGMAAIAAAMALGGLIGSAWAKPNHLEPGGGYDQVTYEALMGKHRLPELWMIERPSFLPLCAVIVDHEVEYYPRKSGSTADLQVKRERWVLEYVVARKRVWKQKRVNAYTSVPDINPTLDFKRYNTTVTKEFADAMHEAWLSVLKLTRYPEEDFGMGVDGTTFDFYCRPEYFGHTWSPKSGLPKMLVDLGHKLAKLAQADEKSREPLQKEAVELARKITQEARTQQKKL